MGIVPRTETGNELASLTPERITQLEKLRTDVEATRTEVVDVNAPVNIAKRKLTEAIRTGRRQEVKVALRYMRDEASFAALRKDIDELTYEMEDPVDSTATNLQNFGQKFVQDMPNWVRYPVIGTVAGGTLIAASYVLQPFEYLAGKFIGMFKTKKEDDKKEGDDAPGAAPTTRLYGWMRRGGSVLIGLGVGAGVVRAGVDAYRGEAVFSRPSQQTDIPDPKFHEKVQAQLSSEVKFKPKPNPNKGNAVEQTVRIPGINTDALPVESMVIRLTPDKPGVQTAITKTGAELKEDTDYFTDDFKKVEIKFKIRGVEYDFSKDIPPK
jgi:hypothetical protein